MTIYAQSNADSSIRNDGNRTSCLLPQRTTRLQRQRHVTVTKTMYHTMVSRLTIMIFNALVVTVVIIAQVNGFALTANRLSTAPNNAIPATATITPTATATATATISQLLHHNKMLILQHQHHQKSIKTSNKATTTMTLYNAASSVTTSSSINNDDESEDDENVGVERFTKVTTSTQKNFLIRKLLTFYKFTRPHTIRGTILASICGTVRALRDTPHWWILLSGTTATATATASMSSSFMNIGHVVLSMLPRAIIGMIALLLGNTFIVGINQIYDITIDQMNKPFLPVASGELQIRNAWIYVITSAIVGPLLVFFNFPTILFQLYVFGLGLGCIYSVPPFRTKQNPILAGLTIAVVRGLLLNFGVYYAVKDTLVPNSFVWSSHVSFIARFMTIFASIIAITKDLPDVKGDIANSITTFVTKYGIQNIANGATVLLFSNYIHAIVTGIVQRTVFAPIPMIGGHATLALLLIYRYRQLQANSMVSVKRFYKHIWDLFYLEYVLYAFI